MEEKKSEKFIENKKEKISFVKGNGYKIELYPMEDIVDAIYIGSNNHSHVFSVCQKTSISDIFLDGYLVVDDFWMEFKGNSQMKYVTYSPISSISLPFIAKDQKSTKDNSRLMAILKEAGVSI
jgi:hypothetical protein